MDGFIYPASLVVIAILAFMSNRNNNHLLMFIVLFIGAYIIYSNESGNTATDFKNDMVNSIDESVGNYNESNGIDKFDEKKIKESVK